MEEYENSMEQKDRKTKSSSRDIYIQRRYKDQKIYMYNNKYKRVADKPFFP